MLLRLLSLFVLLAGAAFADEGGAEEPPNPAAPNLDKELRQAIAALDRGDPAVGYALSVRREGMILVGSGAGLAGVTLVATAIETAARQQGRPVSPIVAGIGIPAGLGLVAAGLPALLSHNRFLSFYVEKGPPPTQLGKLRLVRRWRVELLRVRRDTGFIAGGFFGGATVLAGVSWAVRDARGDNGVLGTNYDPTDGVLTLGLAAAGAGSAVVGLLSMLEHQEETATPHRLYAALPPTVGFAVGPEGVQLAVQGRF